MIFVIVLMTCAALSIQYHRFAQSNAVETVQARYVAESETRHARLVGRMEKRRQVLDAMVAFFEASNRVDADEFERFGKRLLDPEAVIAMCWSDQASSGDFRFAIDGHDADALCGHFELLEPSRIVSQGRPIIMLSSFAATTGPAQRGSVSVVFELKSMSLEEPIEGMSELLILNDGIQNTIETYSFGEDSLAQAEEGVLAGKSVKLLPLSRFGNTDFVYLTRHQEMPSSLFDPILMALLALSLSAALLIRNLIVKREEIEAEVELRTSELSQFAYRTSHDLRSPLVTVGGLCRAVREDLEDGDLEEVDHNIARIEAQVGRLDKLVGDILAFTRADLSYKETEPVLLQPLLDEVMARIGDTFPDHGVEVQVDVQVEGAFLFPRGRLHQILENLISNSIKYRNPQTDAPFCAC